MSTTQDWRKRRLEEVGNALEIAETMFELYPATNPRVLGRSASILQEYSEGREYTKYILAWWHYLLGEQGLYCEYGINGEFRRLKDNFQIVKQTILEKASRY